LSSARPTFDTPTQVISFIGQCVEANDAERLYCACSRETSDFWKEHIFEDFRAIQQSETLESVFLRDGEIAAFPVADVALKLGGCDGRTRHLHIDLEGIGGRWYLAEIWKCR
jgi:hypothetical protein